MITYGKRLIASAFLGASVLLAPALPASAQLQNQDGLINVAVGDVTILEDVNIALAAQVAAHICGTQVGPLAVLGQAVDRSGETNVVCQSRQGPVEFEQN